MFSTRSFSIQKLIFYSLRVNSRSTQILSSPSLALSVYLVVEQSLSQHTTGSLALCRYVRYVVMNSSSDNQSVSYLNLCLLYGMFYGYRCINPSRCANYLSAG